MCKVRRFFYIEPADFSTWRWQFFYIHKKTHPRMRLRTIFMLFVDQYCADEVAELTNTFLAKDGIGVAAELGGMTFHHLPVPRMVRIFRDTRCLLANGFPAFILSLFGRRSRVPFVIPLLQSVHLFRTITENRSVRILPCLTTHGYSWMFVKLAD